MSGSSKHAALRWHSYQHRDCDLFLKISITFILDHTEYKMESYFMKQNGNVFRHIYSMSNVKFVGLAWRILELRHFEKNLAPRRLVQEENRRSRRGKIY